MKPTKQHIADKALQLFNEKGFVNIRLQHIADAAFVSVGHLAYHFKTKDALVEYLFDALHKEQEVLLTEYRIVPLFADLQAYFRAVFRLQETYRFFYLDTLELLRAYPRIKEKYRQHAQWKLLQTTQLIGFNISRGALIPLPETTIEQLSWQLRTLLDNWPYIWHTTQNDKPAESDFLHRMWALVQPFFSHVGEREFAQLQQSAEML